MALTATAQSALPSWDETIVPALRKRLETESRILAKRMSIASVSSLERSPAPSHSPRSSRDIPPPQHIPEPRKSSAIPRPSLQYSRSPTDPRADPSPRINGAPPSPSFPTKRSRTYSQPPSPNAFTNNPLPTPDSSRPTSPRTSDVKPTRIPVASRTRTASSSSNAHSIAHRAESRNGTNHRFHQLPTPDTSQDHRVAKASEPPQPTTPPMASIRHQASNILSEPPPFPTASFSSPIRSRMQDPVSLDPRPSNDSEERPFEHWYRGDVHRNGGVGELRVAKHVEMLQIANYGHSLHKAARRQARDVSGQNSTRGRRRADSVDTGTHESLYLDNAPTKDVSMVLDESPLTDIEAEPETELETFYDAYPGPDTEMDADDTIHSHFSTSSPRPPLPSSRSQTPTTAHPVLVDNNNITTPKRAARTHATSDSLQSSSTVSAPPRTSVESTVLTLGSATRTVPRAVSPTSQSSNHSHTKRRAKSPAASSPASTPKKARTKVRTPPSVPRRDDPRSSVATYPTPEGDMVNAIPTWTQPVQRLGNWDEVVLPVVARKRGLDGQYEQADGSPKPKPPESSPVKPAPGTFGYDYTKYRPPLVEEEIQLREFGQLPEHAPLPEEDLTPPLADSFPEPVSPLVLLENPKREDPRQTVPRPPDSPAPFSHYHIVPQVPTINVTRPSSEMVEHRQEQEYDDASGGCCRCVIM